MQKDHQGSCSIRRTHPLVFDTDVFFCPVDICELTYSHRDLFGSFDIPQFKALNLAGSGFRKFRDEFNRSWVFVRC